jgi:hypothetical protein
MSVMSSTVAPPPAEAGRRLDEVGAAALASELAMIFSSRVSSAVSRITLTTVSRPPDCTTPRMSCSTSA